SKQAYAEAEAVLLEELGLADFTPRNEAVTIKSFSESFGSTGRLDAEYYQPKYEAILQHVHAVSSKKLIKLVSIQKSIEPGSDHYADEGIPFLRVADLNKTGLNDPQKQLSTTFCRENELTIQKLMPKKDTILFSKDGTVGLAYKLREDKQIITSGAILHLNVLDAEEVLADYLTLVLNSQIVQLQAERDTGGSIIEHWRVSEIENVIIPIIETMQQRRIANLVERSFTLKAQSEALLGIAKRGVELAIESDEDTAQAWMLAEASSLALVLEVKGNVGV
ncbi:MAG: restriction endonuclease subunit S, partial [Vampirovibrionales bacterium]